MTAPFMATTSAALHTVAGNPLQQADIIAVADCEASAVLQICGANPSGSGTVAHNEGTACGSPGNATENLGKVFREDARILLPVVETLYSAPGASGRPALWKLNNSRPLGSDNPQELIEGVEDMQALYGEDTDDDETADIFVAANAVSDWNDVVSVRVSLLLQTLNDNLSLQAQQYLYNGATLTAGDRRLRRVFTTTVSLRNRIP
jgi:type IV pilus assembly protein PilW